MSQMPSKIWLHKDTKYSTGDVVCGYQYDFVQGIEEEGGIENFVEYVPADAFIEKACKFISDRVDISFNVECSNGEPLADSYIEYASARLEAANKIIEEFRKYMEGE